MFASTGIHLKLIYNKIHSNCDKCKLLTRNKLFVKNLKKVQRKTKIGIKRICGMLQ